MDAQTLTLIAVVAAMGLGFYNAILGGIAGIVICLGITVWGLRTFGDGQPLSFFGYPIDQPKFVLLMAALVAYNLFMVIRGVWRRRRARRGIAAQ